MPSHGWLLRPTEPFFSLQAHTMDFRCLMLQQGVFFAGYLCLYCMQVMQFQTKTWAFLEVSLVWKYMQTDQPLRLNLTALKSPGWKPALLPKLSLSQWNGMRQTYNLFAFPGLTPTLLTFTQVHYIEKDKLSAGQPFMSGVHSEKSVVTLSVHPPEYLIMLRIVRKQASTFPDISGNTWALNQPDTLTWLW